MGRQNKVNHLFKGLRKRNQYTVAEIVEHAERQAILEAIYPGVDASVRTRKAKQLVQSHINARGIASCGRRDDVKVYLGRNFVNHEDAMAEWATNIRRAAVWGLTRRFRIWAPAAVSFLVIMTAGMVWLYPQPDGPLAQIQALEASGDIHGLRSFDRTHRKAVPVITDIEADELVGNVRALLGNDDIKLDLEIGHYDHYSFRENVAASISRLDQTIYPIRKNDLVAVFPFLKDPTWVFADASGTFFPVRLGTNIQIEGEIGYVIQIDTFSLGYRLQNGAGRIYERPMAAFFGLKEMRRTKSVIFSRPEGNLKQLVRFLGQELGKPVKDDTQFAGQVVGFFPPITDLSDLFAELIEVGLTYDGDTIQVEMEPEVKVHVGFYPDYILRTFDLNGLFEEFDALVPQQLEIPAFSSDRYWYFGQSFYEICRQTQILPRIDGSSISLVR